MRWSVVLSFDLFNSEISPRIFAHLAGAVAIPIFLIWNSQWKPRRLFEAILFFHFIIKTYYHSPTLYHKNHHPQLYNPHFLYNTSPHYFQAALVIIYLWDTRQLTSSSKLGKGTIWNRCLTTGQQTESQFWESPIAT